MSVSFLSFFDMIMKVRGLDAVRLEICKQCTCNNSWNYGANETNCFTLYRVVISFGYNMHFLFEYE